jgi:hypothetical protein
MNTQHTDPSAERSRRKAVIAALLVTLLGLTILPGFTCTQESNPDGSSKTTFQSE